MADTASPWKRYTPQPVPGYVNNLWTLTFAHSYWISATGPITLNLAPADVSPAMGGLAPPATFYGVVSGTVDFTPTAGMPVVAVVNGYVCGQGVTQAAGGQVVYVVDVNGDNGGRLAGCGQPGQSVTMVVNDRPMGPVGTWNNDDFHRLNLMPPPANLPWVWVYLPLVRRKCGF